MKYEEFEVLSYIYNDANITQRKLSEKMFVSLGKVNKILSILANEGYIHKGTNVITSKGYEILKSKKVDNAVIMAAGFGSRFVPITFDTPKGLIEVNGEKMIERIILQLKEKNINDISIVVGYLKEKFEYLIDKYDVKLIYNPDYTKKNNISSIYYAQHELKNTYIITSDIYMSNNLFREFEHVSNYVGTYFEEETSEWALKVDRNSKIVEVEPKGGKATWVMLGHVFFDNLFSKKIVKLINEIYHLKHSDQWYWEDVYIRNMKDLFLYLRKLPQNSVLEFECIDDLKKYNPNYMLNNESDIIDTICEVFNVNHDEILNIENLKEGMTNDSFIFEVNKEKYVFRVAGKGTDLLINREQEAAVYKEIKKLNISDKVVHLDVKKGYKITEYIENSSNLDLENIDQVKTAMSIIRRLHKENLKVDHSFDLEERIYYHLELCKSTNAVMYEDFDQVFENIKKVFKYIRSLNRKKTLCHIDCVYANFLFSKDSVTLLDWEYAGMADPMVDVAMFIVFTNNTINDVSRILSYYLERTPSEEELTILYSYISLAGFLWSLWTQYKQALGNDFGTYGMEQYQYGKTYSKLVLERIKL